MEQDFIRGTDRHQARVLTTVALVLIISLTAICTSSLVLYQHNKSKGVLNLSVDVPYVAPGVSSGTEVILRGVPVGKVTGLQKVADRSVRIDLSLLPDLIAGITSSFEIDFRPANYFGVTAVNMTGSPGGSDLVDGQILARVPLGDFTMSTMIEKGSFAINGTLTSEMTATLDKVVRYTNGLNPMIQAGIVLADTVTKTQRALPSELLGQANEVLAVLPAFNIQTIQSMYSIFDTQFNRRADGSFGVTDDFMDRTDAGLNLGSGSLFSAAGRLLASHPDELTPATDIVTAISDVVPDVLAQGALSEQLRAVVEGYERAFSSNGDSRTLNLRIILDKLPVLATPFGVKDLLEPVISGGER